MSCCRQPGEPRSLDCNLPGGAQGASVGGPAAAPRPVQGPAGVCQQTLQAAGEAAARRSSFSWTAAAARRTGRRQQQPAAATGGRPSR